jgi:hypothetical protein
MNTFASRLALRRALQVLAAIALSSVAVPAATPARAQEAAPEAAPAVARTIELGAQVPSLLMLDPTAKVWSLHVTSGSQLDVQAGDVVINSTHDGALWAAGGTIAAKGAIRVAGGTTLLGENDLSPAPQTFAAAADDPLPPFRIQPGAVRSGQKLFINNEPTATLSPGIYTNGIFATGKDSVITMQPGTYIMNGGDFFVSGARLEGEGVTIVMSGQQPGAFWCAAGAQLDLTPPTTGPLQNIVLIARAQNGRGIQLDGATGQMKGLVYSPTATASLSAKADVTLDRLFCSSLSLALGSQLHITGQNLTLQAPAETDAAPLAAE